MRRRRAGAVLVYTLTLGMVLLPLWQLYDWYGTKKETGDAVGLLYQVSLFQMELFGSAVNEADEMKETKELDTLKQAAYSAEYTHERLTLAVGGDRLAKLESPEAVLQFILRLQIGGERPLKPEETKTLKEAAALFKTMFEAYGKLMSSNGELMNTQSEKLKKADHDLTLAIRKNMK